jgi:hypothetical protein
MHRFLPLFCAALALLAGCASSTTETVFEDLPVVETYLQPGRPIVVQISHKIALNSEGLQRADVAALTVVLTHAGVPHTLQSEGNGRYTLPDSVLRIAYGESYRLNFQYGDAAVSAATTVPSQPRDFTLSTDVLEVEAFTFGGGGPPVFPDPIEATWANPHGSSYLLYFENTDPDPERVSEEGTGPPSFRINPSSANTQTVNSFTFEFYGRYRVLLYHINADYAALYDGNGSNSQNLTAPPTSVVNGYGIFTGVAADTLWLDVVQP